MNASLESPSVEDQKSYMKTEFQDNEHDMNLMKSERTIMDLPEVSDIPGQENITVMPLGEMADTTISSDDEEGVGLLDFDEEDDEDDDDDEIYDDEEDESIVIDTEGEVDPGDDDMDDDDLLADDEEDLYDEEDEDEKGDDITASAVNSTNESAAENNDFDEDDNLDDEDTDADITPGELNLLDQGGPVERDSDTDNLNRSKLDNTDLEGEPLNEGSSVTNQGGADLDSGDLDSADATREALGQNDEENSVYSTADTD